MSIYLALQPTNITEILYMNSALSEVCALPSAVYKYNTDMDHTW